MYDSDYMTRFHLRRIGTFGLVLFATASTLLGRAYTAASCGRLSIDALLFAYIGQGWAHGLVLYRDLWDHKPPGIFAVDAAVLHFWPNSFTSIAGLEFCFILGAIYTAYRLAREVNAQPGITTFVAAIACNNAFYNEGGNLTETFLILPEVVSAYAYVRFLRTGKARYALAAGVFSGMAALFKPVGIAPLLASVGYCLILWLTTHRRLVWALRSTAYMCIGACLAWLPFVVYFWMKGLLHEMLFASFAYNFQYADLGFKGFHKLYTLVLLEPVLVLVISLFVLACMIVISFREERALAWGFLLLWAVADIAGALAGGRFYPHYFLPTMASLSLCYGIVFTELARNQKRWVAALAALTLAPLLLIQVQDLAHLHTAKKHEQWEQVARDINSDKTSSSTLFCWDYLPGIYLDTGLRSPTRHLFAFRLANNQQHANEILDAIEHEPASYVVFQRTDNLHPRLAILLSRTYTPWRAEGDLEVYKRK